MSTTSIDVAPTVAASPSISTVKYSPPPADVSSVPVICESVPIAGFPLNVDPISGVMPSNGIIVEPVSTASSVTIVPACPFDITSYSGFPIFAPV